jgi:hypothetical protein
MLTSKFSMRKMLVFGLSAAIVSGCGTAGRVLVIKSEPADAEICIKGKAKSEYFTNQKNCVGSTPFEADRVTIVDPSGDKRVVKFKEVEGDQESFYVLVSKQGYVAQALEVPEWEHTVTLRQEGQPVAPVPANPVLPVAPAPSLPKSDLSALGVIRISSDPQGALVYINDALKGNTPFTYEGVAGPVRLKLELTGYVTLEKILTLEAGQTFNLSFKLQALQSATDSHEKAKPAAQAAQAPAAPPAAAMPPITIEERKAKVPSPKNTSQPAEIPHTTQ